MSKKEKRLLRLFSVPPPTNFRWEELIAIMDAANFTYDCHGGSHYMFEHASGCYRFRMSKTHPSGILRLYQIDDAKEALQRVGEDPLGD